MSVTVKEDHGSLDADRPVPVLDLFVPTPGGEAEVYIGGANTGSAYDVFPDGGFVMARSPNPRRAREIILVQHWFEELRRLAPPQ